MIAKKLNQKGFGLVGILVAGVVLAAVVAGGLVVYNHNKDKNTKNSVAPSSQTSPKDSESDSSQVAQTAQQSLAVKEWGIQIPLTDTIKDAYYVVSNSSKDVNGESNTVWLGLASLNEKGCNATLANQGQSTQLGSIVRVSPTGTDPVSGETYKDKYPNGTTIGNYYYGYKSWTNDKTCTSSDNLKSIDNAFEASVKAATVSQ